MTGSFTSLSLTSVTDGDSRAVCGAKRAPGRGGLEEVFVVAGVEGGLHALAEGEGRLHGRRSSDKATNLRFFFEIAAMLILTKSNPGQEEP